MAVHLPWHDLLHRRARTLAALTGVIVAMVLLYMQIGFYEACRISSTRVLDLLEFDLALTSARYTYILESDDFSRQVLQRAASVDGVSDVSSIRFGPSRWRDPESLRAYDTLALGVDPARTRLRPAGVTLSLLQPMETAFFDRASHPILGHNPVGTWAEMDGHRLRVVGELDWGAGFIGQGLVLLGNESFLRIFEERSRDEIELGLIRLESGAQASAVASRLRPRLPDDVRLWSRSELRAQDRRFFMGDRPIGLMFTSGVVLALLVGAVILFQVLASEVTSRRSELATLQAIGYSRARVFGMLVEQGLLYGFFAFLPATLLVSGFFVVIRDLTRLPIHLTWPLAIGVLVLSSLMCLVGAAAAGRRLRQADPADLF